MKTRRLRKTLTVLVTGIAVAATFMTTGAAQAERVVDYVAMGDSFASGAGVTPLVRGGDACQRSARNYAHLIAAKNDYRLVDVSCGGATSDDFFHSQQRGVRPQLTALSARTDLVTFSIGGNDSNVFADTIIKCATTGGLGTAAGAPCGQRYLRTLIHTIRTKTYPSLVRTMRAVRAKAPNARVYALNYLRLLPKRAPACPGVPIARGDVATANRVQAELSSAIERAAQQTGVTFVDLFAGSTGHDACKPSGVRYVEPLIGARQLVPLHPNALGERQMAKVVGKAISSSTH